MINRTNPIISQNGEDIAQKEFTSKYNRLTDDTIKYCKDISVNPYGLSLNIIQLIQFKRLEDIVLEIENNIINDSEYSDFNTVKDIYFTVYKELKKQINLHPEVEEKLDTYFITNLQHAHVVKRYNEIINKKR